METPLHRKLLLSESESTQSYIYASPPPPPSPVADPNHAVPYLVSAACALGVAFLILTTCTVLLRNRFRRRRVSSSPSSVNGVGANPVGVDHPIWHIVTIGLPQSVIDSIASVKYKSSDGGAIDCSVCLTEFEDGDDVRVLPECAHAFHLPCIDTWLRSHKNCPLCRSSVIVNDLTDNPGPTAGIENSHDSDSDNDDDDEFDTLPLQGPGMMDWKSDPKRVLSDLESSSSADNGEGSSQMIEGEDGDGDADKQGEGEGSGICRLIKTSSSSIGRSSARILSSFRGSRSHSSSIPSLMDGTP